MVSGGTNHNSPISLARTEWKRARNRLQSYSYFVTADRSTFILSKTGSTPFSYLPRNGSVFVHNSYNPRLFTPWMPREGIVLQKAQRSGDISMPRLRTGRRIRLVQRGKRDHSQARKGFSEDRHRYSATWRMLWTSGTEVTDNVGLLFPEYRSRFEHVISLFSRRSSKRYS